LAPMASFQLLFGTTPATSELAIGVPKPTKSTLITFPVEADEVTFKVTGVECESEPLVPVIVNVGLPGGVLVVVVIVSVELAPGVIEVGLNEAIAPVGRPLAFKLTEPVKPLTAATLAV
jgi:hypothetical protein